MADPVAELVDELAGTRRRQGVSQLAVADAVGVTPGAVGGWEAHRDLPSPASLFLWAQALGRTPCVVDDASGRWLSVRLAPLKGEETQAYWLRCTVATLRYVRRESGLTQERVARQLGVSEWAVMMWERSRRAPQLPHLAEWCAALGCRLELRCR